jgi:DNA repair protein RadD
VIEPRPYQERAIAATRHSFATGHKAPCLVMPCGAGKTVVAALIVAAAITRGTRCLFVADRETLIDQTVPKLAAAGVTGVRVIQADRDDGPGDAMVTVASAQTLRMPKWIDRLPPADLIIWDECHGVVAATFRDVLQRYPGARLLGLTATPTRGDNKPLEVFDDLVIGTTIRELTELNMLAPCHVVRPPEGAVGSNEIAIDPVTAYRRYAAGQRAGVFCLTRKQADGYAANFIAAGIPAAVVTATTRNRGSVLARFAAGEFRVLVSVGCLTQGWDDPGCAVAILARKPGHVGLWIQICGRVLRPHPDKREGLIVDLCGAIWDHGPPDMDREYSLDGKAISTVVRDRLVQCRSCGACFLAGPRACLRCGAEMPVKPLPPPRVLGIELQDATTATRPRTPWVSTLKAKHDGHCRKCGRWFPAGTPIFFTQGERGSQRHQTCPAPALMSATANPGAP